VVSLLLSRVVAKMTNQIDDLTSKLILAALDIQSGSSEDALVKLVDIISVLQTATAIVQMEQGVTIQ
jgi:hypothetical protein